MAVLRFERGKAAESLGCWRILVGFISQCSQVPPSLGPFWLLPQDPLIETHGFRNLVGILRGLGLLLEVFELGIRKRSGFCSGGRGLRASVGSLGGFLRAGKQKNRNGIKSDYRHEARPTTLRGR